MKQCKYRIRHPFGWSYRPSCRLRLILLSDTHGLHRSLPPLPIADVLIFAGDITVAGESEVVEDFDQWLGTLTQIRHKIVVAGNHDTCLFESRARLQNAFILYNEILEVSGLRIYGSPCSSLSRHFQHFQHDPENECSVGFIPDECDVLVTHGPPYGIGDRVLTSWTPPPVNENEHVEHPSQGSSVSSLDLSENENCVGRNPISMKQEMVRLSPDDMARVRRERKAEKKRLKRLRREERQCRKPKTQYSSIGCKKLRDAIASACPRLHVFGHCHEEGGKAFRRKWSEERGDHTVFVNASNCSRKRSRKLRPPVICEIVVAENPDEFGED